MTLAEALMNRADLQKRIEQVKHRLLNNAKVQEGEAPAERPEALLAELDTLSAQLETLTAQINLTNSVVQADGTCLTRLLAQRECLKLKLDIQRDFLTSASAVFQRGRATEIKVKSTVKVSAMQAQVDRLAKELRELEVRIQSLNWTITLQQ